MKKIGLLLVVLVAIPSQSWAVGDAMSFAVNKVRVDKTGKGYIEFVSPLVNTRPACSTHTSHLAFDTNTPAGKGILSLGLSAKASGKKIRAQGTGDCSVYGTVESWNWGWLID